uniref:Uncharacterized protein n=1 Tax=Anguilla anguilla TaxID=7936 RepID=A0A0E9WCC6_ANGAN
MKEPHSLSIRMQKIIKILAQTTCRCVLKNYAEYAVT